jgi:hypothetical protein
MFLQESGSTADVQELLAHLAAVVAARQGQQVWYGMPVATPAVHIWSGYWWLALRCLGAA